MPNPVTIPLVQGQQWWLLYVTSKFGLSAEDVLTDKIHGVAVALDAILSQAKGQPVTPAPWQEFGTGEHAFRIGNARPVQVLSVSHTMPSAPKGKVLADRNTYAGEGLPSTIAENPWYVALNVWWRAESEQLPWPAFTSLFPLLPDLQQVNGAEVVLAKSVQPDVPSPDPGDASWGSTQTDRVVEAAKSTFTGALWLGAAAAGVAFLILTLRHRK